MKLGEFLNDDQSENLFYLYDYNELLPVGIVDNDNLAETGKIMWCCDKDYDGFEIGPRVTEFSELLKCRHNPRGACA